MFSYIKYLYKEIVWKLSGRNRYLELMSYGQFKEREVWKNAAKNLVNEYKTAGKKKRRALYNRALLALSNIEVGPYSTTKEETK